jgi:hypothetical protein
MNLKHGRSTGNGAYVQERQIGPKLVFDQMATPVPEIMDTKIKFFH